MANQEQIQHKSLVYEDVGAAPEHIDSRLVKPFTGMRHEQMNELIDSFIKETDIDEMYTDLIRKGAFLAQDAKAFSYPRTDGLHLRSDERRALELENPKTGNKWNQRWIMYALVGCCSLGAAVQGMDEVTFNSISNI